MDPLMAYLATHRRLPRIEIGTAGFPPADAHRARARIAHYAGKSGIAPAGVVAGMVVLLSTGILIPMTYRDWNYLLGWGFAQNLSRAVWMILPALCAGLIVYVGVELWIRVKLLQELKRLRRRSLGWSVEQTGKAGATAAPAADVQRTAASEDGLTVLSRLSELHIVQLHALYQQEWWSKGRSLDATRRGVKGSQVVIGLVNQRNELVAFARVLTDYTFKALIFDVIVAEAARNQKLGRRLMELIIGHESLREVRHFELYCLPELVDFYLPHGFSTDTGNIRLMRMTRDVQGPGTAT